jgi:lysophospholipase L1-like esterase
MAKRFGPKRPDGIVEYHWDGTAYDTKYVNPNGWNVDLNACGLGELQGSTFTWEVNGVAIANPNPSLCTLSHEFKDQGVYAVRVTRTNPDQTSTSLDATVTIRDILIVSLGDSFASGQGNPDIRKDGSTPATWVDTPCARSSNAGPAQAAIEIEDADPHSSVTFLSFACTGAEIEDGILKDQTRGTLKIKAQIKRLNEALDKRAIDALIISAGGNDIGFSELVARCITQKKCNESDKTLSKFNSGIGRLDDRYKELNKKIGELPAVKKVFITEYPDLVRNESGKLCSGRGILYALRNPLEGINEDEAKWASENVITDLNAKVKAAAAQYGWVYVAGVFNEFKEHGYCAEKTLLEESQNIPIEKRRWVRTFAEAKQYQGVDKKCDITTIVDPERFIPALKECLISSGSVHPTEEGHKAYAKFLVQALRDAGITALPGS